MEAYKRFATDKVAATPGEQKKCSKTARNNTTVLVGRICDKAACGNGHMY